MSPPRDELLQHAMLLSADAAAKLARWLVLFEHVLANGEAALRPPELKDFTAFLTCLKRALEIARLASLLEPRPDDPAQASVDPQLLRQLFSDDD